MTGGLNGVGKPNLYSTSWCYCSAFRFPIRSSRQNFYTLLPIAARTRRLQPKFLTFGQVFNRQLVMPDRSFKYEKKMLRMDQISADFELIYRNKETYLRGVTWFAFAFVLLIPASVLYALRRNVYYSEEVSEHIMELACTGPGLLSEHQEKVLFTFLFVTNVALYSYAIKFPSRIYYNGEKYVAVFSNKFFPFLQTKHSFVTVKKYNKPAIQRRNLYVLGTKKARLIFAGFRRPIDMYRMTGEVEANDTEAEF